MRTQRVLLVLVLGALVAFGIHAPPAAAQPPAQSVQRAPSPAVQILQRAITNEKEPGALDGALVEIDALIAKAPTDAEAHYARGWILSHCGKPDLAIAAYDKALALDGRFANAAYNAGVVLAEQNKVEEALARFDTVLAIDPGHVDAAYNAGQGYYDLGEYAKAADRWTVAARTAPDDFQIAKKLVQAWNALGKHEEAGAARANVIALRAAAQDPRLKSMKGFVNDQFAVGKYHIFANEYFDISGDLAYLYQFDVATDATGRTILGSVNIETSALIRELGTPFVLGMNKDGQHTTFRHAWKTQPDYKTAKAAAIKAIKANF